LVCGAAKEVLPLWDAENPRDEKMSEVVDSLPGWLQSPSIDSLLKVYRAVLRVSDFHRGFDLSPLSGMFPEPVKSNSAGDYAGDCIVWAGRAVVQYHVGMGRANIDDMFLDSAETSLANSVEAVARSWERGWTIDNTNSWPEAQARLKERLSLPEDEGAFEVEQLRLAMAGEHSPELQEILAWTERKRSLT
jgi:hypothetical protein